jgi:hypothetical protein
MTGTDQVMLHSDVDLHERTHIIGWPHAWPPPERVTLVYSRAFPGTLHAMITPEGLEELEEAAKKAGTTAEETYELVAYDRVEYSKLPDDMVGPDSHVCRGAAYALAPVEVAG